MKESFHRAKNIVLIMTSLFLAVASVLVIFGAPIVQAGYFVVMGFVSTSIGSAIAMGVTHLIYKSLAEDCNCPIEDIYYATEVVGWQTGWIRNNIPSFSSRLAEEKRKRLRK